MTADQKKCTTQWLFALSTRATQSTLTTPALPWIGLAKESTIDKPSVFNFFATDVRLLLTYNCYSPLSLGGTVIVWARRAKQKPVR
jgi:hypothetical protein